MREVLRTPEGRAQIFAHSVQKFSTRHFVVEGDWGRRQSTAGVLIRHILGNVFEGDQVSQIVSGLDAQAKNLGGQRVSDFAPLPVATGPYRLHGLYEFSAETLLDRGLLE